MKRKFGEGNCPSARSESNISDMGNREGRVWDFDRQPDWNELGPCLPAWENDGSDEDVVLESRRRQHRLLTPQSREADDDLELVAPGAPVRCRDARPHKRRTLFWLDGMPSEYAVQETQQCDAYVQVESSQVGGVESEGEATEDGTESSTMKSFIVDDSSSSVAEEEARSRQQLGQHALEEEREHVVRVIAKAERRLRKIEEELRELQSGSPSWEEV